MDTLNEQIHCFVSLKEDKDLSTQGILISIGEILPSMEVLLNNKENGWGLKGQELVTDNSFLCGPYYPEVMLSSPSPLL